MSKKSLPNIKRIELNSQQAKEFMDRTRSKALLDDDYELILAMTQTIQCISRALEEKTVSIKTLLKYLFGAPTETAKNVLKKEKEEGQEDNPPVQAAPKERPRPKGHGRNGADAYLGADRVQVAHPELKSGDPCPECFKGKIYELSMPALTVRIVGSAPLMATVYELVRLRCNLCGYLFTAPAPDGAQEGKYDESATAMVAFLKYGCGMPFYRMEKLQEHMGMPVPASTQWDIIDAGSEVVTPVFNSLERMAAQGEILHNDDTAMKILSEIQNQKPEEARKGIHTSGIISICGEHKIAIFMTGRKNAGDNLGKILKDRASGLAPPIQMCDGAKQNLPKGFETILTNCLTHARRYFVKVVDAFPQECRKVIEYLGEVYHHDDLARQMGLDGQQRLLFHQEKSAPVMEKLHARLKEQFDQNLVEPNSGLGKAVKYMLAHWEALTRFLHVPDAPLDNNIAERALKMTVLNRKNSYFYKTLHGAHVGDVFMSLIHTCQLAGENPFEYLTALLKNASKVADAPQNWLPWNFRTTLAHATLS